MSNCHGCAIQHPSLMMDGEDIWMYYHYVVEKIDLSLVLNTAESACSTLVIKLGSVCYRIALEFEGLHRTQEPEDRILRVLYDGHNRLKWKEFGDRGNNIVYHESVVGKDEEEKAVSKQK